MTKDEIEITYDGANYVLKRPVNGFRIAQQESNLSWLRFLELKCTTLYLDEWRTDQ